MNIIVAAGFLVFSGYMFFATYGFPVRAVTDIGPAYWPRVILGGMFIFSLLLLMSIFVSRRSYTAASLMEKIPHPQNFWLVFGCTAAYVAVMEWIGFVLATLIYLGTLFWLLKFRQIKPFLLVVFGSTLFSVLLFPLLLGIPLPRGTGLFRSISLFFY